MKLSQIDRRKAMLYAGGALLGGGFAIGVALLASRLGGAAGVGKGIPVTLVHTVNPQVTSVASERVRGIAARGIQARLSGRAV